jgi:hypothetical protein
MVLMEFMLNLLCVKAQFVAMGGVARSVSNLLETESESPT